MRKFSEWVADLNENAAQGRVFGMFKTIQDQAQAIFNNRAGSSDPAMDLVYVLPQAVRQACERLRYGQDRSHCYQSALSALKSLVDAFGSPQYETSMGKGQGEGLARSVEHIAGSIRSMQSADDGRDRY